MTELVTTTSATDWFDIGPTGVQARGDVPQAVWESVTVSLLNFAKALPWVIGDLLNYGEASYGETYAQAIDMTGLSYHTLARYRSVAAAIPYEQRAVGVPWSYYTKIKTLPPGERQEWIERAAAGDFGNGDDLRDAIKDNEDPPTLTKVLCPSCRCQLEDKALERGKCQECKGTAPEWAVLFNQCFEAATALRMWGDIEPWEKFCARYT